MSEWRLLRRWRAASALWNVFGLGEPSPYPADLFPARPFLIRSVTARSSSRHGVYFTEGFSFLVFGLFTDHRVGQ